MGKNKKSSTKWQSLKNVFGHSRKAAKKKKHRNEAVTHDAVLHLRRMANMSTKEGGALLSNVSLLESLEDSSSELSSSSSESTCASLSLSSENEHGCFETDGKRSRKRRKFIKRKRPRGLKYRSRFPDPLAQAHQKTSVNLETTEVDGGVSNSEINSSVLEEDQRSCGSELKASQAVHNAADVDDSDCDPRGGFSSKENSSADIDELSSLSSFISATSADSSLSSDEENCSEPDTKGSHENQDDHLHVGAFMKDPLYQGAEFSVFECCTLIMLFVIKHKLTKAALQDLLYLIKTVIPSIGCKMITSIYRVNGLFLKFFGNGAPTMHYMCNNCGTLLKQGKTQCKSSRACKQSGTVKFAELNVEAKLKELFLGKTYW